MSSSITCPHCHELTPVESGDTVSCNECGHLIRYDLWPIPRGKEGRAGGCVGELLSVDFTHPDCDASQMVLHVRTRAGGVTTGPVHVRWRSKSDVDPAWQAMRDAILHDPDHDNDAINWALGFVDEFAPHDALER